MKVEQERLIPKRHFAQVKVLAWAILGPLNPASWTAILFFEERLSLFGLIAFLTIWPSMLGAAIGLFRLKNRSTTRGELVEFVVSWALLTIPIYTCLIVIVGSIYLPIQEAQGIAPGILKTILFGLALAVLALPYSFMMGTAPAICAALVAYWILRVFLFESFSHQSATPSRIPAASSAQ